MTRRVRNRFVGRRRELELARRQLAGGLELLTLWGPGGAGKTRIARALQGGLERDGSAVAFCDLTDAASPTSVRAALRTALELDSDGVTGSGFGASLAHALAARSMGVLIIDNAEAALEPVAAIVSDVLASERGVQVVVTSRERLQLSGEHSMQIAGLEPDDAVALFAERAREANATFAIADEDRDVLAETLQRLECLPLAIELAASRLEMFTIAELAAQLSEDFAMLATRKRDVPLRHSSLEATFAWSWNLLAPTQQRALAQLSVFAKSFRPGDAAAVVGVDSVQQLLDKALVVSDDGRLRIPGPTRAFARARLADVGAGDEADRHAAHFASIAEDEGAATDIEVAAAHYESSDPASAVGLFMALGVLADRRGQLDVSVSHWRRAAACASTGSDTGSDAGSDTSDAGNDAGSDAGIGAQVSLRLARAEAAAGQWNAAEAALADALSGPAEIAVSALAIRARCRLEAGDVAGVEADLQTLLGSDAAEVLDVDRGRALTIRAALGARRGELEGAATDAQRAADLLVPAAAIGPAIEVLFLLGAVLSDLGRVEETEQVLSRARALAESHPNRRLLASARMYAANVAAESGDPAAAAAALATVAPVFAGLGDARMEAVAGVYLGLAELETGNMKAAALSLEAAVAASRAADPRARSFAASCAAIVAALREDLETAEAHVRGQGDEHADPVTAALADLAAIACDIERARRAGGPQPPVLAAERRLAAAVHGAHSEPRRLRAHLLSRLSRIADDSEAAEALSPWRVAADGSWFQPPGGERVDLGEKAPTRNLLEALADAHMQSPDHGLSTTDLIRRGWPAERLIESSGKNRVWVTLAKLRQLGLREILVKGANGYMLRPTAPISVV